MKKDRKTKFLEVLEKTPIIQYACDQVDISRNTYYRWMEEDLDFRMQVTQRMQIGIDRVNDFAENNVLKGIRNGDAGMTKYWLGSRHSAYRRPFTLHLQKNEQQAKLDKELEEARQEIAALEVEEWQLGWLEIGIPDGETKRPLTKEEIDKKRKELIKRRKYLEGKYGISN